MFATATAAVAAPVTGAGATHGRLPLLFERNDGQLDPAVRFLSRAPFNRSAASVSRQEQRVAASSWTRLLRLLTRSLRIKVRES